MRPALVALAGADRGVQPAAQARRRVGKGRCGKKERGNGQQGAAPEEESAVGRASEAHGGIVMPA